MAPLRKRAKALPWGIPACPRPLTPMRWLLLLAVLAACGRPLSEAERAFMAEIQPGLQTERIRMVENPLIGLRIRTRPARPRTTCREMILPPDSGPTVQTLSLIHI